MIEPKTAAEVIDRYREQRRKAFAPANRYAPPPRPVQPSVVIDASAVEAWSKSEAAKRFREMAQRKQILIDIEIKYALAPGALVGPDSVGSIGKARTEAVLAIHAAFPSLTVDQLCRIFNRSRKQLDVSIKKIPVAAGGYDHGGLASGLRSDMILILLKDGWTPTEVAEALKMSPDYVRELTRAHRNGHVTWADVEPLLASGLTSYPIAQQLGCSVPHVNYLRSQNQREAA